jgi:hypothetical protein
MRKLILIAAFIAATVATADAGQSRGLVLANADTPAQAQPAVAPAPAEAQQAPSQAQLAEPPRLQASRPTTGATPTAGRAMRPRRAGSQPATASIGSRT